MSLIIRSTQRGWSVLRSEAASRIFRCLIAPLAATYSVAMSAPTEWRHGARSTPLRLTYSRFDNEVRRTIVGVGPSETATGRFAMDLLGARLEPGPLPT